MRRQTPFEMQRTNPSGERSGSRALRNQRVVAVVEKAVEMAFSQ
jgi:hypothetical protein